MKRRILSLLLILTLSGCMGIPGYNAIDSVPTTNGTISLGSPTQYWDKLYVKTIVGLGTSANITGAGTANTITKWTGVSSIGNSSVTEAQVQGAVTNSHAQNTDRILTYNGVLPLFSSGNLTADLRTDRWLKSDTNTFLGVDVVGLGLLAHTGGLEGWYNTFYGNNAGRNITKGYKNTYIGESAGYRTTTGFYNTFVGADSGSFTSTGQYNTSLGYQSFNLNTLGSYNTAIGLGALASLDSGNYNTAVGLQSLNANTTGSYNTALGVWAGKNNTGNYNVFIGKSAGENSGSESHMLYIDDTNTTTPLISGNFTSNTVTINDTLNMAGNITMVPGATVDGVDVSAIGGASHTQNTDTILTTNGITALINAGTLKNNLAVDPGITVDGVDISTLAASSGNVTTVGGTANKISKFTGSASIGNSSITDNGTQVTVSANITLPTGFTVDGVDISTLDPAYTYTISSSGAGYTTIQAALTANPTANALFLVYPGTYTNDTINFTANRQSVIGIGTSTKQIVTSATAAVVNFGAYTNCVLNRITVRVTAATSAIATINGSTGSITIDDCTVEMTNSNVVTVTQPACIAITGAATVTMLNGFLNYTNNVATTAAAGHKIAVSMALNSTMTFRRATITLLGAGVSEMIIPIYGTVNCITEFYRCKITVTDLNTTAAVGFSWIDGGSGTGENYSNTCYVTCGAGAGHEAGGLIATGTRSIRSMFNYIKLTGNTQYPFQVDSGATIVSEFDDIVSAGSSFASGTGILKYINSISDGNLKVSENITAKNLIMSGNITMSAGMTVDGVDVSEIKGYSLQAISANQVTTTDSQTMYWGGFPVEPSTTANRWRIYIPKTGTIKSAYIYSYSGTAGTNENWSMYIRYDNTTDTLIQTLAANTNDRVWSNAALGIAVVAGHYIEIKEIQPAWATNPDNVTRTGVIYIE